MKPWPCITWPCSPIKDFLCHHNIQKNTEDQSLTLNKTCLVFVVKTPPVYTHQVLILVKSAEIKQRCFQLERERFSDLLYAHHSLRNQSKAETIFILLRLILCNTNSYMQRKKQITNLNLHISSVISVEALNKTTPTDPNRYTKVFRRQSAMQGKTIQWFIIITITT